MRGSAAGAGVVSQGRVRRDSAARAYRARSITGAVEPTPTEVLLRNTSAAGVPQGRWTSKAGSLVGQLGGCSRGDYKKIIHGGVPG
jgi:hypothetical protein